MIRMPFLHDIRVFDGAGHHLLGHVVTLATDGLDMVADEAFASDQEYSFMLDDIMSLEPGEKVRFSATCDRCDVDGKVLDLYHIHLCFTHLSPQAEALTQALQ